MVESMTVNHEVVGSNPTVGVHYWLQTVMIEHSKDSIEG